MMVVASNAALAQSSGEDLDFSIEFLTPSALYSDLAPRDGAAVTTLVAIPLGDLISIRLSYVWNGTAPSPLIMPLEPSSAIVQVFVRRDIIDAEPIEIPWRWDPGCGAPADPIQLDLGEQHSYDTYLFAKRWETRWLETGEKANVVDYLFKEPGEYEIYAEMRVGTVVDYQRWLANPSGAVEPELVRSNSIQVTVSDPIAGWESLVEAGVVEAIANYGSWESLGDIPAPQLQVVDQVINQLDFTWLNLLRENAVDWIGELIPLSE